MGIKGWIGLGVGAVVVVSLIGWWVGTKNTVNHYHQDFKAQNLECRNDYDNMWKTLEEKYNLKSDYADDMRKIIEAMAKGREGGALFKSITEAMPGLDASIYKEIMATIEGKRNQFQAKQSRLIAIATDNNKLVTDMPTSFILSESDLLEVKLVTSTRTEQAFETGKDDQVLGQRPIKPE